MKEIGEAMKDYRKENVRKKITGCVLLAAGFALLFISRISQESAQWYSEHIYPMWVGSIGRLSGLFPCSLSEVLLYILLLWIMVTAGIKINHMIRKKETKASLHSWLWSLFLLACILFCLYEINCGVNYRRDSFSEGAGISARRYSAEELEEVCMWLTEEVNSRSKEVPRNAYGVMKIGGQKMPMAQENVQASLIKILNKEAVRAMERLGERYPELSGDRKSVV